MADCEELMRERHALRLERNRLDHRSGEIDRELSDLGRLIRAVEKIQDERDAMLHPLGNA